METEFGLQPPVLRELINYQQQHKTIFLFGVSDDNKNWAKSKAH